MQTSELSKVKQDLIAEIEKRVEDHVLEPSNAALLSKLITQADNDNEAMSIAALGTTYKRTGLHFDKRLEPMTSDIRYFRKNEALSFHTDDSKPTHKLIIGDNYEALQNLLVQYTGAIDVIYIDPPYGKDSMGEFAQTNYQNAITRDNLLSMLYPRLQLAKQLLSDSGVIFCSIDDKNQAYLKCLFDEVFGERNYLSTIPRKGSGGRQDSKQFAVIHEYILTYARNIDGFEAGRMDKCSSGFNLIDTNGKNYKLQLLRKWGDNSRKEDRPNLYYPIFYSSKTNTFSIERQNDEDLEIYPILEENKDGRWRWGKDTMKKAMHDGLIEVQSNKKGEYIPYERIYEDSVSDTKPFSTWIDDIDNSTGSTLLKDIMGDGIFDYPKPVDLIKRLLKMASPHKDITVLDFFAGSGTTGHAVLDLNRSEETEGDLFAGQNTGGKRTFILCQLNEKTDTTPNGIAYDVTAKRLKRIMTGECYNGSKDFEWIRKNKPYGGNLDVYELATVPNFEYTAGKSAFEVIDETLYGHELFTNLRDKIEWVCTHFQNAQRRAETDAEWQERTMQQ